MAADSSGTSSRGVVVGKVVSGVVTCAAILGIGLYGGFMAARQGSGGGGGGEHGGEEGHEAEAHAEEGAPKLSAQTLSNLGVEFGELAPREFVRTREVAAVVEARPDAKAPVHAPVAGRVVRTLVRPGQVVRAGEPIAEIMRDPFPRPVLALTDAVLKPLNEDFHRSTAELPTAAHALRIVREELARVRKALGAPADAAPSKVEIDLGYEERKALRALESARAEARRHGLTDEEIAAIEDGTGVAPDAPPVRRVLERNRLWSPEADAIRALLPKALADSPYAVATLGELSGSHVLTDALVEAVRSRPAIAAAFLDVAGLLQSGETVAALEALDAAGAFAPVVAVRAPADAPDFDVASLAVRAGAHVEAGAVVAELEDARTVVVRLAPTGGDVLWVEKAVASGVKLMAEPLIDGAGVRIQGFSLRRMDADPDGAHVVSAIAEVGNAVLAQTGGDAGPHARTWALRSGLRYAVHVPVDTLANKFVVPADAVIPRGADSVVVLKDGASYRQVPVRVDFSDSHVAVLANDGAVFPGDTIALKGAYALSLALQAGSGGGGGGHHHHH